MGATYAVRRAFVHEGQYVTNDNVHDLPVEVLEDRLQSGHVERLDVSPEHEAAAARAHLAGVDFASDEAAELAADARLTAAHFAGRTPGGKGGFTAADVRRLTTIEE
jgi:hypothetical protein